MGRTTIIAKEKNTDKIAVIPVRILENSSIEPMVETAGSHTVMLKVDGSVWTYGKEGDKINDEPEKVKFNEETLITQIACRRRAYTCT